jgi:hypothetical protein
MHPATVGTTIRLQIVLPGQQWKTDTGTDRPELNPPDGPSAPTSREVDTVESTVPSGHHTSANLLRLVGAVRRLAFDHNLPSSEALGRIGVVFHDYDHQAGM